MEMKEIIIVTDGKSNIGGDPLLAAMEAQKHNIVVSAIGIIGKNESDENPIEEIQGIAKKGKGEWELTYLDDLSVTLQMMTQKTVNKTIGYVVNRELKEIIGSSLDEIKPKYRNKFIEYIENLSDEIPLKCCILIDCSGSMKQKLERAKESILDLMNSLRVRKGKSEIAVIAYPGVNGEMTNIINGFTDDVDLLKDKLKSIFASGTTPTAPAIYKAIELFTNRSNIVDEIIEEKPFLSEGIV
ncbi:Ca-activated chloride channel family protein [Caminicella sporogenes DSM 14501]|uniref:Ca-activated chloride channel family protein n=1 Tax=Caminicella sporogenes DSM 14501 TaxID=1121266 RepID=A0A1M6QSN5_9FIRM|nr:vWA domain-containing protein [Caminicella sporogenes]RKD20929.1 hypothetical protein BET04_08870 [Caminicella sporogenes]WIF95663.1 VWA domain-containing protein [Caminicella sporogenes]SHK23120.1 Ca-activated chloride channel family protein [Caminicella sporogenes DSM 14501]